MNIKISYSWLLEYLDTDATPDELQKYLSLCGPSVEKIDRIGDDYVFDIEITSNRIDTASIVGIAQEAQAILPMFEKKAKFKSNPLQYVFKDITQNKNKLPLQVKIIDSSLCPRFSAIVFENINIAASPSFIKNRLTACGIKSINNVVDVSNYLMLAFGQPVHVFDYDQIKDGTMIMRESKKGERIVTLDKKEVMLPGKDIVIEDGSGRLIDLCGIMGGLNSAINEKTKNVILFIQTYDKKKIRKTSISTGIRTIAATFFEKGLDPERVEPTLVYGVKLLEKYAQGKVVSQLYDIYPKRQTKKQLKVPFSKFEKIIGIKIEKEKIQEILTNLGFKVDYLTKNCMQITVPSWRTNDIDISEDIIEEVARIYGYQNLPSTLQSIVFVNQPKEMEDIFLFQNKIKLLLKHLGLNEVINYSLISKDQLIDFGLEPKSHLKLSNALSKDNEYLRTNLLISLYKNIKDNSGKKEILKLFEIGKIYLPQSGNLPNEIYKIGIAVNSDYFDLKGIVEAIYKELNVCEFSIPEIIKREDVYMTEIDFKNLIERYQPISKYQPINPFAVIKLDRTFEISPHTTYAVVRQKAFQSKLLLKIEVVTLYQNKLTLRFYYSSKQKNITEEEAKKELEKIKV